MFNSPMFLYRSSPSRLRPFQSIFKQSTYFVPSQSFSASHIDKMPEPLKASEVNSRTDPAVAKQWDDKTPKSQQIEDFYKTVDGMKIGLLTTIREGLGPVSRSMAVAKVCTLHIICAQ